LPGRIYTDIVTVGAIEIYQVTVDPNGVLSARIGSLAVRNTGLVQVWQNTNGLTAWALFGGGSVSTDTSKWVEFPVGTATTSSVSSIPAGSLILRRKLIITTPYSAGATITLDNAGALTIMTATQNSPQFANEYQRGDRLVWPGAAAVRALVAGAPVLGAGLVLVEYVQTPLP